MGNIFWNGRTNKNELISTIMVAQKQVIEAYEARGFKIRHILADGQF